MGDKQDETSLACILNELRKTDAEQLAIPDTECYNLKSDIDVVKYTFDNVNNLNGKIVSDVIHELVPSTSSTESIENVEQSTLESRCVKTPEKVTETKSLLSHERSLNEIERTKPVKTQQFRKNTYESSTIETLKTSNLKKPKESNREPIFKKKLKSLRSVGIKQKNADETATVESISQQSSKSVKCSYSLGEIVWAKIAGYSHWPAMIDEDPDIRWHFWPTNTTLPTHYHVVFFDTNNRLSRSWVKPGNIKVFTEVIRVSNSRPKEYIDRFKRSVNEAKVATKMTLKDRLKKYSFKERVNLPGIKLCQD